MTSTIAVIPGTGNMGFGLSRRLAKAGYHVLLGSRDASNAENSAKKILAEFPNAHVQAGKNEELPIKSADFIVWCPLVAASFEAEYLKSFDFSGKIVIDITNYCYKQKDESSIGTTSSTERNIKVIPTARWVAALKNVYHVQLSNDKPDTAGEIFSDDQEALQKVKSLFESTGFPISNAGPLEGARGAEKNLWQFIKANLPSEYIKEMQQKYGEK